MRIAYLDEAGISSASQEPYLVVAGVLLDADRDWSNLKRALHDLSERYELPWITYFHATDIFSGRGTFDKNDPKWPNSRRRELLLDLVSLLSSAKLPVAIGYVHRPTFKVAVESEFDRLDRSVGRKLKRPPLHLAAHLEGFFRCAKAIDAWMAKNASDEKAMLIAENVEQIRKDIKLVHAIYQDTSTDVQFYVTETFKATNIIETIHFAEKREAPLLQLADICAFVVKRHLMKKTDVSEFYAVIEPLLVRVMRNQFPLGWEPYLSPK